MKCMECGQNHALIDCPHLKDLPGVPKRKPEERKPQPSPPAPEPPADGLTAKQRWRIKNKEKIRAYQREYMRKRRKAAKKAE